MESLKDIETYNKVIQEQRLYQLLIALDDRYEAIKIEILKIEPLLSVENAYAVVHLEDTRSLVLRLGILEEKGAAPGIGVGLAVRDRGRPPWQNQQNSRGGHDSGGGFWNRHPDEDKSKLTCSHYGREKHTRDQCFKIVGFSEGWETRAAAAKLPPSTAGNWNWDGSAAMVGSEQISTPRSNPEAASNSGGVRGTENRSRPEQGLATATVGIGGSMEAERRLAGGGILGFGGYLPPNPHVSTKCYKTPKMFEYL